MFRPIRPKPLMPTLIAICLLSETHSILCTKMDRIYRLVLRLGLIVLSPYFLLPSRRYRTSLSERLGYSKLPQIRNSIWVHAVSVGEVKAVEKLLGRIREEFPGRPLVVSTTTPTGQQLVREKSDTISHTLYF